MQAAVRDFIRRSNERRIALESSPHTARPLFAPPQLTAAAISMSARVAEIDRAIGTPLEKPSSDSFARSDG